MKTRSVPALPALPVLAVIAIMGIFASGCGHRPKETPPKTWAQIADEYPDSGYFLCRHDFSYAYDSDGNTTKQFIAVAGEGRKRQKKAILGKCTSRTTFAGDPQAIAASRACASSEALNTIRCAHEAMITPPFKPNPDLSVECTLTYHPIFEGRKIEAFQSQILSNHTEGGDLVKQVRSVITQCLTQTGAEQDGCTEALIAGQLSCRNR